MSCILCMYIYFTAPRRAISKKGRKSRWGIFERCCGEICGEPIYLYSRKSAWSKKPRNGDLKHLDL